MTTTTVAQRLLEAEQEREQKKRQKKLLVQLGKTDRGRGVLVRGRGRGRGRGRATATVSRAPDHEDDILAMPHPPPNLRTCIKFLTLVSNHSNWLSY